MQISLKQSLKGAVPLSARSKLSHHLAERAFDQFMVTELGGFYGGIVDAPIPPADVAIKTSGLDEQSFDQRVRSEALNREAYLRSGYIDLLAMLRQGVRCGLNLRTVSRVFELGCGDGRLLRHMLSIDGIEVCGSDTRPEAVAWCERNLTGAKCHVNGFCPPIGFLDDTSIDLAYAFSVFTHIPLQSQDQWIAEMRRIIKPGGYCLITVIGRSLKEWLPESRRRELEECGQLEITSSDADAHLATRLGGSLWDVYQSRSRIIEAFSRHFDVIDFLQGGLTGEERASGQAAAGQDLLVLRRPHS